MNIHTDFGLDHTDITFTVGDNGFNWAKVFIYLIFVYFNQECQNASQDMVESIN